jgi:hypothetical protein
MTDAVNLPLPAALRMSQPDWIYEPGFFAPLLKTTDRWIRAVKKALPLATLYLLIGLQTIAAEL